MLRRFTAPLLRLARRARDARGNVMMLFAFSLLPLTFATGMGIDYARAMRLQTKVAAAADAAVLAAVSKTAMGTNWATATYAANLVFSTQTSGLIGAQGLQIVYAPPTVVWTGGDTPGTSAVKRTVTLTWSAKSTNAFASILGMSTLNIRGVSSSTASNSPNIDFYVMMDVSQSMLLPASSADLNTMVAATQSQCDSNGKCGCAFACHVTGSTTDNYSIATANHLTLRSDLVNKAVSDLTTTATSLAGSNGANYRMGLFDFDYAYRNIWPTSANGSGYYLDTSMSTLKSHVADAQVATYCSNNYRICGTNDNDTDTNFTNALSSINTQMKDPGSGTNATNDKPKAILFIITDGMRDEETTAGDPNSRTMGPLPSALQTLCGTIKNTRNIQIAILQTEYLPSSASDTWSITNVKNPFLSPTDYISPALQSCASSGLYYKVTTDDDISAALASLFQQAVAAARLTQ